MCPQGERKTMVLTQKQCHVWALLSLILAMGLLLSAYCILLLLLCSDVTFIKGCADCKAAFTVPTYTLLVPNNYHILHGTFLASTACLPACL